MLLRGGRSAATEGGKRIAGLELEQIGGRAVGTAPRVRPGCVFRERKKRGGRPLLKPDAYKEFGELPPAPSKFYLFDKICP